MTSSCVTTGSKTKDYSKPAPPYIITGIDTKDNSGRRPARQDVDEWYRRQLSGNRIQLTLFVEALTYIQSLPPDDILSYFRLAGIHAAPWAGWDGEHVPDTDPHHPGDPEWIRGFCVHNDYTFPTWHRVYMTLFEQVVYEAMLKFLQNTDNVPKSKQAQWKKEAEQWRLPFWDFARFADLGELTTGANPQAQKELRLPILCMMPQVKILKFNSAGTKIDTKLVSNPLHKFSTPGLMGELNDPYTIQGEDQHDDNGEYQFTYPWDKCSATTKYGVLDGYHADIWADAGQNFLRCHYALNEHSRHKPESGNTVPTLQDMVYRLLTYDFAGWGDFASTRYVHTHAGDDAGNTEGDKTEEDPNYAGTKDAKNTLSLESIHNNVHNWVGGSQFTRPDNNQDLAIWGSGHMSSVFMAAFDPIFWLYHCNIDRLTAIWQVLNPDLWFNDDDSCPSKDNDLVPFHKDADRNFFKSVSDSDCVRKWTNLGYDYEILQGSAPGRERPIDELKAHLKTLYGQKTEDIYHELPLPHGLKSDYIISAVYDRFALNGSAFRINIFVGEVTKDEFQGPASKNFVASIYNFSGSLSEGKCDNCTQQKEKNIKSIAQVPATVAIRRYVHEENERKGIKTDKQHNEEPGIYYVVLNSQGQAVNVQVTLKLHGTTDTQYKGPGIPWRDGKENYGYIRDGHRGFTTV
ncbi:hypothetical protein AWENTII_000660 [Aspergillus wentii]|nr:hypothetical protein MW887_001801 [Aspergillus wentii]